MDSPEFEEFNKQYNEDWNGPIFPFISPNRITALKAGLYKKFKAKWYGVTAVFDERRETYIFPLYGFYWIEEDIVIIPPDMELTSAKRTLGEAYIKQGFKQVPKLPSLRSYEFPVDSIAAKLALMQKTSFSIKK